MPCKTISLQYHRSSMYVEHISVLCDCMFCCWQLVECHLYLHYGGVSTKDIVAEVAKGTVGGIAFTSFSLVHSTPITPCEAFVWDEIGACVLSQYKACHGRCLYHLFFSVTYFIMQCMCPETVIGLYCSLPSDTYSNELINKVPNGLWSFAWDKYIWTL
jgi:hypothetical protein